MPINNPCNCSGGDPTLILYEDGTAAPRAGNVVTLERPSDQVPWTGVAGNGISIVQPGGEDATKGHHPTLAIKASRLSPVPILFTPLGELSIGPAPEAPVVLNGGDPVRGGIRVEDTAGDGRHFNVSVELAPGSPIPVTVDDQGRLYVGPIDLSAAQSPLMLNGGAGILSGIRVTAGGPDGHSPTVEVSPAAAASSTSTGSGRITFDASQQMRVDPPYPWSWESVPSTGSTYTLRLRNSLTNAVVTIGTA